MGSYHRQQTTNSREHCTGLCGIYLKKMNPNLKKLKMACAPLVAVAGGGKWPDWFLWHLLLGPAPPNTPGRDHCQWPQWRARDQIVSQFLVRKPGFLSHMNIYSTVQTYKQFKQSIISIFSVFLYGWISLWLDLFIFHCIDVTNNYY